MAKNRILVFVAALFLTSLVSAGLQSQGAANTRTLKVRAAQKVRAAHLPALQAQAVAAPGPQATYVGSSRCGDCHAAIYARWARTRMANVVTDPKLHPEVIIPDLSKADPLLTFTRDDIAFVYGSKWKQRYFKKVGDDYFPLPAQWDVTN